MASVGAKKRAKREQEAATIEKLRTGRNPHAAVEASCLGSNQWDALDLAEAAAESPALHQYMLRRAAANQGAINCVYFIRMGTTDAVKIGKAWSGAKRLAAHQVSSPVELTMEAFINFTGVPEMQNGEAAAHKLVAEDHLRGEWFRLDRKQVKEAVLALIDERKDHIIGALWKVGK